MVFTFHWKVGLDPWLIENALKSTTVPAQTFVGRCTNCYADRQVRIHRHDDGIREAGLPDAHVASLVSMQLIESPSKGI